jgi:hypothetical protein
MMRHDQRPRRQRHKFPGDEKRERVVSQHDERHAGEKGGEERQYPSRRRLVAAIAESEDARDRGAEVDHGEEKSRERVEAEMRAEPGQADRQRGVFGSVCAEKMRQRDGKR